MSVATVFSFRRLLQIFLLLCLERGCQALFNLLMGLIVGPPVDYNACSWQLLAVSFITCLGFSCIFEIAFIVWNFERLEQFWLLFYVGSPLWCRCTSSRDLLKHHQKCTSVECPVCMPVKDYVRKQRAAAEADMQRRAQMDRAGAGARRPPMGQVLPVGHARAAHMTGTPAQMKPVALSQQPPGPTGLQSGYSGSSSRPSAVSSTLGGC
jgi:hypothetical protein